MGNNDGVYRLNYFGTIQLVSQILLVISLIVHVISNVKPVLIAFGMKKLKDYAPDLLLILGGVLLFTGIAFVIYYIRWKTL